MQNDPRVNPKLAVDLSAAKRKPQRPEEEVVADLSAEAIKARARQVRLQQAAAWARSMHRTFKGQRGGLSRRGYAILAIRKFDLVED